MKKNGFTLVNDKKKVIILLASLIIIISSGVYTVYASSNVKKWSNKIYPGVNVCGIDLGGQTEKEAIDTIRNKLKDISISDEELKVNILKEQFKLNLKALNPKIEVEETVKNALNEGKNGNFFAKNIKISRGLNVDLDLKLSYEEDKLAKFENDIKNKVNKEPVNATLKIEGENIIPVDGESGIKIDDNALDAAIKKELTRGAKEDKSITLEVETTEPNITKDKISKINGVIGSFWTDFSSSTEGRATNVTLATKALNGKILMPGETFSYNDTLGERTPERGYKPAAIFVSDGVQDGIGGGICQVSTTLYRAVMNAGIKSVERHNHSFKTSYSSLGLDATVVFDSLDYKFKNTYNNPIFIEGKITDDRRVIINIYGNKEELDGRSYELISNLLETLNPSIKEVPDPTLPVGQTKWDKQPITGYRAESYLITNKDGKEIAREKIATDEYVTVNGVKFVGAMNPVPEVKPVEPPNPEVPVVEEQKQEPKIEQQPKEIKDTENEKVKESQPKTESKPQDGTVQP